MLQALAPGRFHVPGNLMSFELNLFEGLAKWLRANLEGVEGGELSLTEYRVWARGCRV